MDLDDYQTQAGKTAIYSDADAVVYPVKEDCFRGSTRSCFETVTVM